MSRFFEAEVVPALARPAYETAIAPANRGRAVTACQRALEAAAAARIAVHR